MKLMKPIASTKIPRGNDWVYEVKYDGFRCVLVWEADSVKLISRNDTDLSGNFPEIIAYCRDKQELIADLLPLTLDGELVVLNNAYQANFGLIQKRGRLGKKDAIRAAAQMRPACLMVFDLLHQKDNTDFNTRKKHLAAVMERIGTSGRLRYIPFHKDPDALWREIFEHKAEGMVAKKRTSAYGNEKQHRDWYKIKNWRTITVFLTFYNPGNGYFTAAVYDNETIHEVGKCKHGHDHEQLDTLKDLFLSKGKKEDGGYRLPPAICASLHTLDLHGGEIREPEFVQLLPEMAVDTCTWKKLQQDLAMLPKEIEPSHTDKIFWPEPGLTKGDLLVYMREIAPYMLPFLCKRRLTVIRCPDGVHDKSFFQKHLPEYAPEYIQEIEAGDEVFFSCEDLRSLTWFSNHGAIEFHVPFQKIGNDHPCEIVFDLDPPGREAFPLAIKAAELLKEMLDGLELTSFVKTSGGKGLQVHIPIPANSLTYDETAIFTQAIAWTIERGYPDSFTTERLKEKRGNRLYIDYVQHGKDKTLISPYSPRKTADASVSAPLFWEEVRDGLTPDLFTIENAVERVKKNGCPFDGYWEAGERQKMDKLLKLIR
ncbi:DNA ligase D [Virgibacillus siamensis]|uniref:DNA ligase D n=1 Tax=Virgibacillus siamensis TaxID=480071 RepID=UPI0009859DEC|nr:DNA ligase D [Virgibacillus siamensis]